MRSAMKTLSMICLISTLPCLTPGACAQSPIYFPGTGHWYQPVVVPELTCWTVCRDSALALGGHLATIRDSAENEFVQTLAAAWANTDVLLGGWRQSPTGPWEWVTGEAWAFQNWDDNQPGQPEEQYLRMILSTLYGRHPSRWFDFADCDWYPDAGPIVFVVEYEGCLDVGADLNCDGVEDVFDVIMLIDYTFGGGPRRVPCPQK